MINKTFANDKDGFILTFWGFAPHVKIVIHPTEYLVHLFWANLCRLLGCEQFVADQWAEGERRDEMFHFLRAAFREKTLAEWTTLLGDAEVCFGPVNSIDDVFADPQVRHRNMIVDIEGPMGPMRSTGVPIKLSDTPGSIRTPPAIYGEHTDAVLAEIGYSSEQIAALRAAGAV